MKNHKEHVSLNIYLNPYYTELVNRFTEQSARAFGLESPDALKLTLACEEMFTYLCRIDTADQPVTLEAQNGIYFTEIKIIFNVADFDPCAFNITTNVSLENEKDLDEMGLVIASRSVDKFSISHEEKNRITVFLVKEKTYPEISMSEAAAVVKPLNDILITTPDFETLKEFSRLTVTFYESNLCPNEVRFPGKLVDMHAAGEFNVLVAVDRSGTIGGGVIWRRWHVMNQKIIECAGPYVFGQPDKTGISEILMDALIGDIAKTEAICLVNLFSTPETPLHYFERLGTLDYYTPDGTFVPWQVFFRLLNEDTGCRIWTHPDLAAFLDEQYKNLYFARNIATTHYAGESRPPHSVLSTEFVRTQRAAFLRPVWDGVDISINLAKHIKVLKGEGILNIFLLIDLGYAWQANLAPAIGENNFMPQLILPYAGKADIVIFQYKENL